ncbi:MAG: ABC transporter ATP-binding protein [Clostridiales bacterium]|nr:ABC transporter ATP-binding protein [Clostridiales bacterium]
MEVTDLTKKYVMGEVTVNALCGVSFNLYSGEFVAILGASGSGKSTMLNIIGGIDKPTSGEIKFRGKPIGGFTEKELTNYRRLSVGFVFQFYNLIPNLTAKENIALASELSKEAIPAAQLLTQIDMADRADHFPSQLSGGQQQRIAIARALSKNPTMLLCDEPTGALDFSTGIQVLKLLKDFNTRYKKTVAIITHNAGIGAIADRVFHIKDGLIEKITVNENPLPPEEVSW